jgi:transposase, IS30 family
MIPYKQLTFEQRYTIELMLKQTISKARIAQTIGRSESTLYRELKRNSTIRGLYRAEYAQMLANERKKEGHFKTVFSERMKCIVETKLTKEQWSPEQITGWCKTQGIDMVSHERIYQFIWLDKKHGGGLYQHLRHGSKKYRKRYGKNDNRGRIKGRVSIDQRPEIVHDKNRTGDWEMDLIEGKYHKGTVLTMVERKTGFTLLAPTDGKKANSIKKQAINSLAPFKNMVYTITNDNGSEFSLHKEIGEKLDADIYFCHPYASWERGLNEYTNKLIRQYLPKKLDLRNINVNYLSLIASKLNNRPRKNLGFKTPFDIFMNNFNP